MYYFPDALLKTKNGKKLSLAIRKLMIIKDPNHEKYQIDTAFYGEHRAR